MVCRYMMDERCAGIGSAEAGGGMLELVLCLGLAMLLVSSVLPRCVQMDRLQLEYEALCLLNDLRYVQSWSHGMDYCHIENYDKKPVQPSLVISRGEHYVQQQVRVMNWRRVENGMKMYTNRAKFQFSPRGHATAGTVVLRKGGHEQRVVVDTVGRVRLEERQI
ncbi:hypothetical protein [Anaerovibrio sp.]|uniref:hypothetical protein n=1 Tax=Anaerovibrio sp. TaxID=1872532 RepID=UPI003F17784B